MQNCLNNKMSYATKMTSLLWLFLVFIYCVWSSLIVNDCNLAHKSPSSISDDINWEWVRWHSWCLYSRQLAAKPPLNLRWLCVSHSSSQWFLYSHLDLRARDDPIKSVVEETEFLPYRYSLYTCSPCYLKLWPCIIRASTLTGLFVRNTYSTPHWDKYLISQSNGSNLMHLRTWSRRAAEGQTDDQNGEER